MGRKVTPQDRVIDFCMTGPVAEVERVMDIGARILKSRKGAKPQKDRPLRAAEVPKEVAS